MSDWHYEAWRLNGDGTESLIDAELPLNQGTALTRVLSGPHGFSASISPAFARLVGPDGRPLLQRWSTAIYAYEGDNVQHGCILSQMTINPQDATLGLNGIGFTGLIKDQPYEGSTFFVETEPLDIARHIWDHWQSRPRGNVGLELDRVTKTGKKIGTVLEQVEFDTQAGPVSFEAGPYKLNEWETDDLGGRVDSLATDQGFDYFESHYAKAGGVGHRLDFGAPRIGTRRSDLRFVAGENVFTLPQEEFSESTYADTVLVLGAGEGRTTVRKWVPRDGESRLRRVAVISDKAVKSATQALNRGKATLPSYKGDPTINQLIIMDHPNAPLGSWSEGDEIEFESFGDWGSTTYPVRVLSTTFSPDNLEAATVSVVPAGSIAA